MKKIINIICTAIICLSLTGQAELVLNTANDHDASEPPDETTEFFRPVLNSDSTSWDIANMDMPGIYMRKLYAIKNPDSIYAELYSFIPGYPWFGYSGKIREDTISGKLWYILPPIPPPFTPRDEEEILIMDLTLEVGDTFDFRGHSNTVDSVYFLDDGRKIIRFDVIPIPSGNYWNENDL